MRENDLVREGLARFAEAVTVKTASMAQGAPEDQLRAPFEGFLKDLGAAWGWTVTCTGEATLPNRLGRPDYAVSRNKLLTGHVELKRPGTGASSSRFSGHDKEQFTRFANLPNVLYTDGNEWALYRSGKRVRNLVRLAGAVDVDGPLAVGSEDGPRLEPLLRDFLEWQPILPLTAGGSVDLRSFAELVAPLCRMLRNDVTEALSRPESPIHAAARDWRHLLFPEASDEQFADAYAQTVAFALLLGRSLGADPLNLQRAQAALAVGHSLMSRALAFLTDDQVHEEIEAGLDLLLRVIGVVPPATLGGTTDPWLHFYEDFLAKYDPKLRKKVGVYYTPVEVVRAQVRLVDDLLTHRLGQRFGFASRGVVTLDPAVGTGTYLLGVIEHALGRVEEEQGPGAVAGQASSLAKRLYGFEVMVGPYAVAELRTSRALRDRGGDLPGEGTGVYLVDTLDSPDAEPQQLGLQLQPIADQRSRAVEVKKGVPVLVCIGNPPYHRHGAVDAMKEEHLSSSGGWVRFGDPLPETERFKSMSAKARLIRRQDDSLLASFTKPVKRAGHGGDLKNLYNSYVYFWRWALWKLFEQPAARGPGVVSFITASSYLHGDAFVGVREHMKRLCDEIWILDLGGEGRGTRRDQNIFAIQTPVAVAVAFRSGTGSKNERPATVRYARVRGTRREKLDHLDTLRGFDGVEWQDCPSDWQAPFLPAGKGRYFGWPLLTDLMPWQKSGVKAGRTWVIAPDRITLEERVRSLGEADPGKRRRLFKDSPTGRKVSDEVRSRAPESKRLRPVSRLDSLTELVAEVAPYSYRSFDRQLVLSDVRVLDRESPALWQAHSSRQLHLTSLLSHPLDRGPALVACAHLPDLDHFRGSYGAKHVLPLYRSRDATEPNILPGLLALLSTTYGQTATAEDFAAYTYGVLAQPAFVSRFFDELTTCELRLPITKNGRLFYRVRNIGAKLLWLHTYGERFQPEDVEAFRIEGSARCAEPVPGTRDDYPDSFHYTAATKTLHVGEGEFAPVLPEVFEFEVSGLKVVQSWLGYRMKSGAGKKSSPLDDIRPERWTADFTTELLQLLHVLERTLALYTEQSRLLDDVLAGDCFEARELPPVPDEVRRDPKVAKSHQAKLYEPSG